MKSNAIYIRSLLKFTHFSNGVITFKHCVIYVQLFKTTVLCEKRLLIDVQSVREAYQGFGDLRLAKFQTGQLGFKVVKIGQLTRQCSTARSKKG